MSRRPEEGTRDDVQPVPEELKARTNRERSRVPDLGLGVCRRAVPSDLWQQIDAHWERVRRNLQPRPDDGRGFLLTTRAHPWAVLFHEDRDFNRGLLEAMRPMHEAWYGGPLEGVSCYGIRVYLAGAYLLPHVDRIETHAVSSTLCVAKRLERPWPLCVDVDGHSHEVELEPGEMLHYESARLEHGRPYPLQGEYYVGLFLHYRPPGWRVVPERSGDA